MRLARPGAVIIVDNVIRDGRVLEAHSTDPSTIGARSALDYIGSLDPPGAAVLQTVGSKGHDGFAIFVVPDRASI
jgi:predicted O-methyltransferase YrrM